MIILIVIVIVYWIILCLLLFLIELSIIDFRKVISLEIQSHYLDFIVLIQNIMVRIIQEFSDFVKIADIIFTQYFINISALMININLHQNFNFIIQLFQSPNPIIYIPSFYFRLIRTISLCCWFVNKIMDIVSNRIMPKIYIVYLELVFWIFVYFVENICFFCRKFVYKCD